MLFCRLALLGRCGLYATVGRIDNWNYECEIMDSVKTEPFS